MTRPSSSTTMIGSTSAGTRRAGALARARAGRGPRSGRRSPAANSVTSGAPSDRNASPTISRMSATLAASTSGSASWISSYCASRAGAAPVTPTTAPRGRRGSAARSGRRRRGARRGSRRRRSTGTRRAVVGAGPAASPGVADRQHRAQVGQVRRRRCARPRARRARVALLRPRRQAVRVAGDDHRVGVEREPEPLGRVVLLVRRRGRPAATRSSSGALPVAPSDGSATVASDRRRDPGDRDDGAEAYYEAGEGARHLARVLPMSTRAQTAGRCVRRAPWPSAGRTPPG